MRVRPCMPSAGLSPSSLAPPLRSRIMPCKVNGGKCEEERLPRHASYAYAAEKKGKEFADVTGACGARRNAKGGGEGQCGKLSQAPPYASEFHGFRTLRRRIISRCYREVRSLSLSSSSSSSPSFSISRHFALAPISGPLSSIATAPPFALPPYPLSLVLTTFLVAHVRQKTEKVKLVKRNCQSSILPDFESARPLKKNPP